MRIVTIAIILSLLTFGQLAADPLSSRPPIKDDSHVGQNPGRPDGREGGETFADAVPILELPYHDTGNTSDNIDDYGEMCPYGSWAPDVVYSFISDVDMWITIDLCLSLYDTALFVWDVDGQLVACNDDFYIDHPECLNYRSKIEGMPVLAGEIYYITVDGYTDDSGEYDLVVTEHVPEPCELVCDGLAENEPPLMDGYVDIYNSGCGTPQPVPAFQELAGDDQGELVFCGISGWYDGDTRDTDWFTAIIGPSALIQWTMEAEQSTYFYLLEPQDCNEVYPTTVLEVAPCEPATMVIQGSPGDVVWLWVGPTGYSPPSGFTGHEYTYISSFEGLEPGTVGTTRMSFDGIKSLYR